MAEIPEKDQEYYALLVQQWNFLPAGELDLDTMPYELKTEWIKLAPKIASLLKENGGFLTGRIVLGFYVNEVIVPWSHGLDHNPSVTDE